MRLWTNKDDKGLKNEKISRQSLNVFKIKNVDNNINQSSNPKQTTSDSNNKLNKQKLMNTAR